MIIPVGGSGYRFTLWTPTAGRVFAGPFAFRCETTRPDPARPWLVPALVLGTAFDGEVGVYIPRLHLADFWRAHAHLEVVFHHAAFHLAVLAQALPGTDVYAGVDAGRVWDTALLHRLHALAAAGHTAGGEGEDELPACAREHLGGPPSYCPRDPNGRDGFDRFLNSPQNIPDELLVRSAADAVLTMLLFRRLGERIDSVLTAAGGAWGYVSADWLADCRRRWGPLTHHTQLKASVALSAVTANGLRVDPAARDRLAAELNEARASAAARLREHCLLADPAALRNGVQAKLKRLAASGVPVPRTADGRFATDADTLTELADRLPFAPALLAHRAADHLLTAFVGKLGRAVLHPAFGVLARTGRTTSSGQLNAQGVPRAGGVRECVVPSPGRRFVAADYAAIELVALAQACRTQFGFGSALADRLNAGEDPHRAFAAFVTGKPPGEVTAEERRRVKAITFGMPGGMGVPALRAYAKAAYGVEYTEREAEELSARWLALFPEMRAFLADDADVPLALARRLDLSAAGCGRNLSHGVLGGMLLKVLGTADPRTGAGDPYRPADLDYLWGQARRLAADLPDELARAVAGRRPSRALQKAAADLAGRGGVLTLTGRLRAAAGYTQRRNTVFQGLAADGAKLGLWRVWRAGYRVANFVHDELLVEVPADADPQAHARRIEGEMAAGMREVLPDVLVRVDTRVGDRWGACG